MKFLILLLLISCSHKTCVKKKYKTMYRAKGIQTKLRCTEWK